MRTGFFSVAAMASAMLVSGCGGASFTSDYDPGANFSSLQTFQWAERPPQENDDPRLYNAITENRVKNAINYALTAKGYREVEDNSPDFWVAWYGAIEGKMSMTTTNTGYGGWYGYGWYGGMSMGSSTTRVNEWDEGTLVVDIIDNANRELIWRGSVTDVVDKIGRAHV